MRDIDFEDVKQLLGAVREIRPEPHDLPAMETWRGDRLNKHTRGKDQAHCSH